MDGRFRVYPLGVSHDQTSTRLKGLAVLFYVLGMSYGAVAIALGALGCPLSKVAVYNAVQEAGAAVAGLRREAVRRGGGRVVGLGADLTSVRCGGQWLTVGVSVDAVRGTVLSLDLLPNGEAATLDRLGTRIWPRSSGPRCWSAMMPMASRRRRMRAGCEHQVCKAHVLRNTEAWVARRSSPL